MMTSKGTAVPGVQTLGNINIGGISTLIDWDEGHARFIGSALSSTPVSLDVDIDHYNKRASFRLRIGVTQRRSDRIVPLYLMIHSPQIQSVAISSSLASLKHSRELTGSFSCLLLQLKNPPTLVMPPEPLHLKDKTQSSILKSIRSAAKQRTLVASIQEGILSHEQIKTLSDAVFEGFRPSERYSDLISLYGGRGGQIVDSAAFDSALTESPPSYDNLEPPGASAIASCGKQCIPPLNGSDRLFAMADS